MNEKPENGDTDAPRSDPRIVGTLTFRILTAANFIAKPFQEEYSKRFKLGLAEWRCMMACATTPDSSGEDIARLMGMDRMTVSRSLRSLERAGRALRRADPANRKRYQWRLTDEGWAVFDAIIPHALSRAENLFAGISDSERAAINRVLDRMMARDG